MRHYTYIFVRQDLPLAQQTVQAAHAAMQMGFHMNGYEGIKQEYSPPEITNFVLIGVRNEEALEAVASILSAFKYDYETFIESYPKDNATAIATYPIKEHERGPLKAFNLLKVD